MAPTSSRNRTVRPWWVAIVCGMASYIDAAAIVTWSIALVIYQGVFGLTPSEIGLLSGVLSLGVAIGCAVGGRLGDRFGRRTVFMLTMVMIIIGAGMMIVAGNIPVMLIGTALVGLGTGGDLPVSLSTITEAAPDESRGKMLGFTQVLWIIGGLVPGLTSAAVGGMGRLGGQILFAHVAIFALLVFIARFSIPESEIWKTAREQREHGVSTIQARRASIRYLFKSPYVVPFVALLVFYGLFTFAGSTLGQYGTYMLVNFADVPIELAGIIGIIALPVALGSSLLFMKVVGGNHRFAWFVIGGVATVVGLLVPAVAGLSITTYLVSLVLISFGGAFAGESMMKFWSQRSFPALLRTTATGAVIAVARFVGAGLAFVAPLIISASVNVFYLFIAIAMGLGIAVAGFVFRTRDSHNEFLIEDEITPPTGAFLSPADRSSVDV